MWQTRSEQTKKESQENQIKIQNTFSIVPLINACLDIVKNKYIFSSISSAAELLGSISKDGRPFYRKDEEKSSWDCEYAKEKLINSEST